MWPGWQVANMPASPIDGVCHPRFAAVREAFADNCSKGEIGASVAVTVDGELAVNLWGGHADEARIAPWRRDTITGVASTSKTVTALCALLLADRGELNLDAPVARYWPAFAQAGKGRVLVRHLLGHTSGLPGWTEKIAFEDLYDWEKATDLLARQAPWWTPGEASAYHAITQGFLVGEVVRRIADQSLGRFLADEIAGPWAPTFTSALAPTTIIVSRGRSPARQRPRRPLSRPLGTACSRGSPAIRRSRRWTRSMTAGCALRSRPATGLATPGRWR
jgi:CubicO group peptidase (beta-lactamase class C family)